MVATKECRCQCCGKVFKPRPQTPNQRYCGRPQCQRERKRVWQKEKRGKDPDYRDNQRRAQQRWAAHHPDYWRKWRKKHPVYREENRRKQAQRNGRRRQRKQGCGASGGTEGIAKMDVWTPESRLNAGTYQLVPWSGSDCKDGRVNPDNLFIISRVSDMNGDCKERTS